MSTRSQIAFDDTACKVYKHSDGYPSDNLEALLPFVDSFMKHRGFDPEYMVAQLCCSLINRANKHRAEFRKEVNEIYQKQGKNPLYDLDAPDYLGYGVDNNWHGDIEYLYIVRRDGSVDVYTTHDCRYGGTGGEELDHLGDKIQCQHLGNFPMGCDVKEAIAICAKAEEEDE